MDTSTEGKLSNTQIATIRETLDLLIGAVDVDNPSVDEYNVLGKLAVEAGLMWRCAGPNCRGLNHNDCVKCDNCNRLRPRKRETPKADPWA